MKLPNTITERKVSNDFEINAFEYMISTLIAIYDAKDDTKFPARSMGQESYSWNTVTGNVQ